MHAPTESTRRKNTSPLENALRIGALLGAAWLAVPALAAPQAAARTEAAASAPASAGKKAARAKADAGAAKTATRPASKKQAAKKGPAKKDLAKKESAKKAAQAQKPGPLADFGKEAAPPDVVHVANWVSHTRNNKKKAFVLIDKKMAQLYVFDPQGKLRSRSPILLGKATGDHSAPGIGNKPLSQIKEEEKTTPAGRFLAAPGRNTHGEDIIWIDYGAAVSMHRLRKVSAQERRAERMATPDVADNRISNGCVNVPPKFYNSVLKPAVMRHGAFVYVLPETRTPQQQFASFDVPQPGKPAQVAKAPG